MVHSYTPSSSPQALLEQHFTTLEWAQALSKVGIQVTVFYRFSEDRHFSIGNIKFYFIADRLPPWLKSYHLAYGFHKSVVQYVRQHDINIIHAHNTFAMLPNLVLRSLAPRCKMLVQDHAGRPTVNRKQLRKIVLKRVDAVVFASQGQEKPWVDAGILTEAQCQFVMEHSSSFKFVERRIARQKTKLSGQPVFLWVGNLDSNKDPLTALKAFGKFVKKLPTARLFMIYRLLKHEEKIKAIIEQDDRLVSHVTMLGSMTRADLEVYYNSADYIISASHKEGSGFTIIEAMSCGVIPILTRIPSFVTLTNNGKVGHLFEAGNTNMLYEILLKTIDQDISSASKAVLDLFESQFSFSALAYNMKNIYTKILVQND